MLFKVMHVYQQRLKVMNVYQQHRHLANKHAALPAVAVSQLNSLGLGPRALLVALGRTEALPQP